MSPKTRLSVLIVALVTTVVVVLSTLYLYGLTEAKFRDVTEGAGVAGVESQWSTSAGWFDYDQDGDLDLFVCNYLAWSRELDVS